MAWGTSRAGTRGPPLAGRSTHGALRQGGVLYRPFRRAWTLLDEPHTRQLDGQLRELRFHIGRSATRITYWIAPGRRIILLTVFTKTRMREDRQVDRARRALARCIAAQHDTNEED
jgi:phage-related protein